MQLGAFKRLGALNTQTARLERTDASGEDEIHTIAPDGRSAPKQITKGADVYKYELTWSPDGKKILWSDKRMRLHYVDVASKQIKLVAQATARVVSLTATVASVLPTLGSRANTRNLRTAIGVSLTS